LMRDCFSSFSRPISWRAQLRRTGVHSGLIAALAAYATGAWGEAATEPRPPDPGIASEPTDGAQAGDAQTEQARRHFRSGLKLYTDQNYTGALAEFEASYALKPDAGTLRNIALCQKALFRYAEAAATLERLLTSHSNDLDEGEEQTVRDAIVELRGLVGSIILRVNPPGARVTIDGEGREPAELDKSIELNVGEHVLVVQADGYATSRTVVRVAGGRRDVSIAVNLRPVMGFLSVTAPDRESAVAVDGKERAYRNWYGPVEPGRHYIQIYKPGHATFEQVVEVQVGETKKVEGEVGEPLDPDEIEEELGPASVDPRRNRGWYVLGALSFVALDDAPSQVDISDSDNKAGGSFGVRAGYRLWPAIGAELLLEGSRHEISDACDATIPASPCGSQNQVERTYRLEALRVGGNVRLMSKGEKLRFAGALGVGAVRHTLTLEAMPDDNADRTAKGLDPYFMAELGLQYNWGHILLGLDLVAIIDGAKNVRGKLEPGGEEVAAFGDNPGGLPMIGAGIRGGWSEWTPSKPAVSSARISE
jgi:hypothetical protein